LYLRLCNLFGRGSRFLINAGEKKREINPIEYGVKGGHEDNVQSCTSPVTPPLYFLNLKMIKITKQRGKAFYLCN
jgi:hypothetical protein